MGGGHGLATSLRAVRTYAEEITEARHPAT